VRLLRRRDPVSPGSGPWPLALGPGGDSCVFSGSVTGCGRRACFPAWSGLRSRAPGPEELRQETGITARVMRHLGTCIEPEMASQGFDVFVATGLTTGQQSWPPMLATG
jgi:hypothetical protein